MPEEMYSGCFGYGKIPNAIHRHIRPFWNQRDFEIEDLSFI